MTQTQSLQLLGGLTSAEFLAEYWQKKPLLIKNAISKFAGFLSPEELAGLACEDEVQGRLITYKKNQWAVQNGPFSDADFTKLPAKDWTLLVQSVNHHLPEAATLLAQFNFIPHARLDDLMVSYAPDGGGVGPHFDSYDVFLLQGSGRRLWRISHQHDLSVIADAPLRILQQFETAQEWVLEAGDMLYLPPHLAHWGTAVGEDCMTYSIGFRAPKHDELAYEFLGFMQDKHAQAPLKTEIYTDADLTLQPHPAQISEAMIAKVDAILKQVTWDKTDVAQFLGQYLSEPKPDVFFQPNKKINLTTFSRHLVEKGLTLHLKSQLLFVEHDHQTIFFINGETIVITDEDCDLLKTFADKRAVPPQLNVNEATLKRLYAWYLAGFAGFVGF
jgi:50S ribosomal protein L16 3-hydroxylase